MTGAADSDWNTVVEAGSDRIAALRASGSSTLIGLMPPFASSSSATGALSRARARAVGWGRPSRVVTGMVSPPLPLPESGEAGVAAFAYDDDSWDDRFLADSGTAGSMYVQGDLPGLLGSSSGIGADGMRAIGRFRVIDVLGEGRHATVYRAFDPLLEREVALKVPRQGMSRTPRALGRFLGEARALARVRHPRIVPVYEAGSDGNWPYIAMAVIEGQSLADVLASGPLSAARGAEIAATLAEALGHAHGMGIVHRDVKPANVRLDGRGDIFLMDFGIAYRPDSGEVPVPPGMILGTPAYIAPEQAQGGQADVLPASDQYSLGVLLYELLCGRPPFSGPASTVLFHVIHHDPPCPRSVEPAIPLPLVSICRKALEKHPDRRYPSCQALAEDLRRWLRGERPTVYRGRWGLLGR